MIQHTKRHPFVLVSVASSKDTPLLNQWETHLEPLRQIGLIFFWSDLHLPPGIDHIQERQDRLLTAHAVLLLVSADFFASPECCIIMDAALQRSQSGTQLVIPILLRPCTWEESPLASLSPWPSNRTPLTLWSNQEEGWQSCVQELRRLLGRRTTKTPASAPLPEAAETFQVTNHQANYGQQIGHHNTLHQHFYPSTSEKEQKEGPLFSHGTQGSIFDPQTRRAKLLDDFIEDKEEAVPVISPLGLPRPATLVGREAELKQITLQLKRGKTTGIYALNGMGGIGKTALAAEIVAQLSHDHKAFPGGAAWIFCEDLVGLEGLNEIWRRVAKAVGMKHLLTVSSSDTLRETLAMELGQCKPSLLALDNIEPHLDIEVVLHTLAIPHHTTLLLTARQSVAPDQVTSIVLTPLSETSASLLFIQRLKQTDSTRPKEDEKHQISGIIVALGRLPLALELAAAYAGVQGLPLTSIFQEIQHDTIEATALNFDSKRAILNRFNRSWMVLSQQEQHLFAGLSLLKGMVFPRQAAEALSFAVTKNTIKAKQNVAKLVAYALVEPVEGYLRLHPLLGEYAGRQFRHISSETRESLSRAHTNFWREYGRIYPTYNGLSGQEANILWEANLESGKALFIDQATTSILSLSAHAKELQRLGFYIATHGEKHLAYPRIMESLKIFQATSDAKEASRCYLYSAFLMEDEKNYQDANHHFLEALHLLKELQSEEAMVLVGDIQTLFETREREEYRGGLNNIESANIKRFLQIDSGDSRDLLFRLKKSFITYRTATGEKQVYELLTSPMVIGRGKHVDIYLDDASVSRIHATLLSLGEEGYGIRDEGSVNGTWLSSRREILTRYQVYPLHSEDTIILGHQFLTFTVT